MNTDVPTPARRVRVLPPWLYLAVALCLLPFMISSRSLWLDEGMGTPFLRTSTQGELWYALTHWPYSEALMPLSMFLHWLWAQVLGTSEVALRIPNAVYGAITLFLAYWVGRWRSLAWLPLFVAIQPFFWYYLDEFRPYAFQIMCGAFIATGIAGIVTNHARRDQVMAMSTWAVGCLLLAYGTLLGVVFVVGSFAAIAIYLWFHRSIIQKWHFLITGALVLLLLPAGYYYLVTLSRAASARVWDVGIGNMIFGIWELLGFQGLAPGREKLRELAKAGQWVELATSSFWQLGLFALLALVVIHFALDAWSERRVRKPWLTLGVLIYATTSLTILTILALVADFPFWGRHLAPIFSAMVLFLSMALLSFGSNFRIPLRVRGIVLGLLVFFLCGSALSIRYSPTQARQDYRAAVALAESELAQGKVVWWVANVPTAHYYQLDFDNNSRESGELVAVAELQGERTLSSLEAPDLVILSRPDIHDPNGAVQYNLATRGLRITGEIPGFRIYRSPSQ